jgi:hypothetical protein
VFIAGCVVDDGLALNRLLSDIEADVNRPFAFPAQ